MTILYAQPYDLAASGFYYESADDYAAKAETLRNEYGQPVEEFEIQFIDGETIDAQLFEALGINQCNHGEFFEAVSLWSDDEKVRVIIAVGEVGISFRLGHDEPDALDIDLYEIDSLSDLAAQFVEDGLFGDIPKAIENYLDYDAIARDLAMDYGTTTIDSARYAYRAA
ncbi:MAG: antirestriction protein ArdA [Bradyrhizobium sp.]|nr:antirestriction protein ArdA [Bradyrhizobium sp.]